MRLSTAERKEISRRFVLAEVSTLVDVLVTAGFTKTEAAKAIRWAAHVTENSEGTGQ